jgi:hypothetical protein
MDQTAGTPSPTSSRDGRNRAAAPLAGGELSGRRRPKSHTRHPYPRRRTGRTLWLVAHHQSVVRASCSRYEAAVRWSTRSGEEFWWPGARFRPGEAATSIRVRWASSQVDLRGMDVVPRRTDEFPRELGLWGGSPAMTMARGKAGPDFYTEVESAFKESMRI